MGEPNLAAHSGLEGYAVSCKSPRKIFGSFSILPGCTYKSHPLMWSQHVRSHVFIFFFILIKVPRCFRGFQTLSNRGMVVAGTAQARSFPHFAKTRRFIRATTRGAFQASTRVNWWVNWESGWSLPKWSRRGTLDWTARVYSRVCEVMS